MKADLIPDDEILTQFVNDSREHLDTIDADLLAIGKRGANIDADLVNKVLRTAHTIKGTSAFFGLAKVKELAHKAESVLDMIRSKRMIPNAEIADLLVAAFDRLREMIDRSREGADADIDELVRSLTGLITSHLPKEQKASLKQTVSFIPQWGTPVMLSTFDYERVVDSGRSLYSVEYDMIHDIERHGLDALEVFRGLMASGEVLECEVNFKAVGTLDEPIGNRLPMRLIFATALKPGEIGPMFPYNREKVKQLTQPALTLPLVIFE
jgi:two-component system, chemotaxis family, sensor kinase CheA